jgi:glycosyltransferase involved in cell wall biosynthesis
MVRPGTYPIFPQPPTLHPSTSSKSHTSDPIEPKRLIAVIPAFNEEISIGTVVLHIRQIVDHVIVVDDGSKDRTADIARLAGAEVLSHPINIGKAQAVMKGFDRAKEYAPFAVVILDADGQHNPAEIPDLAKPVLAGDADLVVGSRSLNGGNSIPAYRIIGQKTLDIATNISSRVKCTDTQSGFRVLGRRALGNLDFYSDGYNIESDMLAHFSHRGLVIGEVPISVSYSVSNGHKKNSISHGVDVLGHIIGVVGYRRPLVSFGVPGAVLTLLGIGAGLFTVSEYVIGGPFHSVLFIGSIASLVLGLMLMMTSLILNSLVQMMKKERGWPVY